MGNRTAFITWLISDSTHYSVLTFHEDQPGHWVQYMQADYDFQGERTLVDFSAPNDTPPASLVPATEISRIIQTMQSGVMCVKETSTMNSTSSAGGSGGRHLWGFWSCLESIGAAAVAYSACASVVVGDAPGIAGCAGA